MKVNRLPIDFSPLGEIAYLIIMSDKPVNAKRCSAPGGRIATVACSWSGPGAPLYGYPPSKKGIATGRRLSVFQRHAFTEGPWR